MFVRFTHTIFRLAMLMVKMFGIGLIGGMMTMMTHLMLHNYQGPAKLLQSNTCTLCSEVEQSQIDCLVIGTQSGSIAQNNDSERPDEQDHL